MTYSIEQHVTKTGKKSPQWNLVHSSGSIIGRAVSKKQAVGICLALNQTNQNENPKSYDQVPVQQRDAGTDQQSTVATSGHGQDSTNDEAICSLVSVKDRGHSLDSRAIQIQEQLSLVKRRRKENQEPDLELPAFISESFEATTRASNELVNSCRTIVDCNRILYDCSRTLGAVALTAIGIAASVTGTDVGGVDSGSSPEVHRPVQLEVETIECQAVEILD